MPRQYLRHVCTFHPFSPAEALGLRRIPRARGGRARRRGDDSDIHRGTQDSHHLAPILVTKNPKNGNDWPRWSNCIESLDQISDSVRIVGDVENELSDSLKAAGKRHRWQSRACFSNVVRYGSPAASSIARATHALSACGFPTRPVRTVADSPRCSTSNVVPFRGDANVCRAIEIFCRDDRLRTRQVSSRHECVSRFRVKLARKSPERQP